MNGVAHLTDRVGSPLGTPVTPTIAHDPLVVHPEEVRRSLRAKEEALLLRRLRVGLIMALGSYALFIANDILVDQPNLRLLLLIKAIQFSGVGVFQLMLHRPDAARHGIALALAATAFIAFAATVSAVVRGNTGGHVLLLVAVSIGTATMYPWGTRAQVAIVAMCLAFLVLNFYAVDGSIYGLVNPSIAALLSALIISLYIARDNERHRWEIEERELSLRLREDHYRSLIEYGSDLILVLGVDGGVRSVSTSVRLLGYDANAWVNASLFDFVHLEDRARLREVILATASSAHPHSVEVRVRDAGGAWHVLLGRVANLLANPAVEGIVFNARDITRRKGMETELRRSEAALSALIESTTDSVWSVDLEQRFTAMNAPVREAFAQIYGREIHLGDRFGNGAPQHHAEEWDRLYRRAFAGERTTTEQRIERDGVMRYYLISMNPIREHGEISGAVVFSRDITEMRQTAEMARRNQADLTHVLRLGTMGEIAAGLAHEINQPLGAIANYAAACNRKLEAGTIAEAELRRGLDLIAGEALRAGEIIRRLRDLARKGEESMQMVDLNDVVGSAVQLIAPEARLQGIAVKVQPAGDLPHVYIDPIEIEQVVLNLVLNAIEAMQASNVKVLSVRTARVDGSACVAVSDSGSGLDAQVASHVFDPFFTTKANGLGMGLAISRRIVAGHGGDLWSAANEHGNGSTFAFTLPLPA